MSSTMMSAIILLIAIIPATSGISCYICSGGNCNDPFTSTSSSLASGVNITTGCSSCTKTGLTYTITRGCVSVCPSVSIFVWGTGAACCGDRDLCNGSPSLHHTSFILLGFMASILFLRKIIFA